jgi:transposase
MARKTTYSRETREQAVGLVREHQREYSSQWEAICSVAAKLGMSSETLRKWVRQAETDAGQRPGATTAEQERIRELEREVRELRRANEILKAASAFFARELDPRLPRS